MIRVHTSAVFVMLACSLYWQIVLNAIYTNPLDNAPGGYLRIILIGRRY